MKSGFYNAGIWAYALLVKLVSPFHQKAAQSVAGRRDLFTNIEKWRAANPGPLVWVHAASLGEFEQGRPIIEALKEQYPNYKILLTFFSPSGYEVRKNYALADGVFYLPFDTPANAKKWIAILQPQLAIWVKYEYWANFFFELKKRNVPIILVSAIFREGQRFFTNNNGFWKNVLQCVDHFFVQNTTSAQLLHSIGISNYTVAGDTRFDRVVEIAAKASDLDVVQSFLSNCKAVVIGSSYEAEDAIVEKKEGWCWIVAPHEVNDARINAMQARWGKRAVKYSQWTSNTQGEADVLIIDNVGMLASIYRYSSITVIGGGFGKGIHNTLEAAVYGQPLAFGPKYHKFDEAVALVNGGAAVAVDTTDQLRACVEQWMQLEESRLKAAKAAKKVVEEGQGAKNHILNFLKTRLKRGE